MGNDWINGLFGLGIPGLIIGFVIWIIATVITGYLLGVGIWASMPSEIKTLVRAKLSLCYEEVEEKGGLEFVEDGSDCEAARAMDVGKKHFWNDKYFPARCTHCGKTKKLGDRGA